MGYKMFNFIICGTKVTTDTIFISKLPISGSYKEHIKLSILDNTYNYNITYKSLLHKAHQRKVYIGSNDTLNKLNQNQQFCYEVQDIVKFYWIHNKKQIHYEILSNGTQLLLEFWFLKLFYPLYLTIEKSSLFFHASSTLVNNNPIIFIAKSMSGKTTLNNYFLQKKHKFITDDILPIFLSNDSINCTLSFPYYKPYRKDEHIGNYTSLFNNQFTPIHSIYILSPYHTKQTIDIIEIKGFEKIKVLKEHSLIYRFKFNREEQYKVLLRLSKELKIFSIHRPFGIEFLDKTYQTIVQHQKEII